jgi:flagellar basal-body rod protein FlgB
MSNTNSVTDLLNAGIQVENFRQKAIASNFANFETPGYRRVDVTFKELLAACSGSPNAAKLSGAEPEFFEPKVTPVKADGNDTSLEVEVGQMVKNSLRHKTYVRLLNKKYSQIELAIGAR